MKILVVTGGDKRHYYLCQKISEFFPNDRIEVFLNTKKNKEKRIRNRFFKFKFSTKIKYLKKYIINYLFIHYLNFVKQEYKISQNTFFEKYKNNFLKTLTTSRIKVNDFSKLGISINSIESINLLKNICPDVTVVMGSALLSEEFINNSKFILNIHTGLSPYYRGGNSNFWPILDKRPNFCGFTIHQLTIGIDSGPILFSEFVDAREHDLSYPRVNNICIVKAVNKLPYIIKNRKSIKGINQWDEGYHYKNIDFNGFRCFKYRLIRDTFLKKKNRLIFDNSYPKVKNSL